MRTTVSASAERASAIKRMIASGKTVKDAEQAFGISTYHIRKFMSRHGIPIPPSWVAKKIRTCANPASKGEVLCPGMTLPADRLTKEQTAEANRFGILPERAAWLISCDWGKHPSFTS